MKKTFSLFLLCLAGVIFAATPVFQADYEENFSGQSRGKTVEGKVSQELLWETLQNLLQPGVKGNAAVVGTSADKGKLYHAVYKNSGIINPFEGTISFCIKPVNWNGDSKDFHVFFQASGADATLMIYKYINTGNLMFLLGPSRPVNGKYQWSMAGGSVKKWRAGEWHHIAAAYDRKAVELFIDGKMVSKVLRPVLPQKDFSVFSAGAISPAQWKTQLGLSLLDELKIFDKKLSFSEIGKLASSCVKAGKVDITGTAVIVDRDKKTLDFYFTVEGIADRSRVIVADSGKTVFSAGIDKLQAQNRVQIDFKNFKPGKYSLIAEAVGYDGKVLCRKELDLLIPKLPEAWKNNKIGVSDKVLPPWTELKGNANSVSGKTFELAFGNLLLPGQVTADGTALLSRPAELLLNGRALKSGGKVRLVKNTPGKKVFAFEGRDKSFKISGEAVTEFDGFTWVKLVLEPEKQMEINSLRLDFPFKKQASTLFNSMNKFYMNYQPGHCGNFKSYCMNLYKRPPVMFVGNDKCGLQWFCEELSNWYNADKDKALQLIPGSRENLLRLNLIDRKTTVRNKLVYEFGFQSVPLRPMPQNWRKLCPYRNFDPYFVWSKYHHYPYADALRTDAAYKKLKTTKTARFGKQLYYYFAGFTITPTFPEWSYYSSEWMLTPPELGLYGAPKNPAAYFTWICPRSAEYRDFYLDRFKKILETLNIENIYIDNSDAQMCDNARHGCGYTGTDGKRYSSFNLRGTRTLARRVYTLIKERNPEGRVIRHMSAKPVAPVVAFADMIVDGELYNKTVALDESYFNIFTPDMFRASFCGKLWGIPQFFIPQFTRVIPWHNPARYPAWKTPEARLKQMDKIRHFKGYFLVHDTQVFQLFGVNVNDVEKIKERFGLRNETCFISYSEKALPWKANPGVLVSGYVDNGKLMLIVMNGSNSGKVDIFLDAKALEKLGVRNLNLFNAETGKAAGSTGKMTLSLAKHDYMILWNVNIKEEK